MICPWRKAKTFVSKAISLMVIARSAFNIFSIGAHPRLSLPYCFERSVIARFARNVFKDQKLRSKPKQSKPKSLSHQIASPTLGVAMAILLNYAMRSTPNRAARYTTVLHIALYYLQFAGNQQKFIFFVRNTTITVKKSYVTLAGSVQRYYFRFS